MFLDTGHRATGFGFCLAGFASCFNPISPWSPLVFLFGMRMFILYYYIFDMCKLSSWFTLAELRVWLESPQGPLNGNKTWDEGSFIIELNAFQSSPEPLWPGMQCHDLKLKRSPQAHTLGTCSSVAVDIWRSCRTFCSWSSGDVSRSLESWTLSSCVLAWVLYFLVLAMWTHGHKYCCHRWSHLHHCALPAMMAWNTESGGQNRSFPSQVDPTRSCCHWDANVTDPCTMLLTTR